MTENQILGIIKHSKNQQITSEQLVFSLNTNPRNVSEMRKLDRLLKILCEKGEIESNHNDTGFVFGSADTGVLINSRIFILTPEKAEYIKSQQIPNITVISDKIYGSNIGIGNKIEKKTSWFKNLKAKFKFW